MVWPPSVKGLLVTESVRGDGGILKNSEGKRFMFDYIPEFFKAETADNVEEADRWYDDKKNNRRPPELLPRDEVARAINSEIKAGRGSPHGGIYLDIASRRTPEFIHKRLPSMYHQFKELADVDITKEPMEIGPTCHYVMGGVEVDPDTELSGDRRAVRRRRVLGRHARLQPARRQLAVRPDRVRQAGRRGRRRAYASGLATRPRSIDAEVDGGRAGRAGAVRPQGRRERLHDPGRPPADDERPGRHHPHRRTSSSSRSRRSSSSRSGPSSSRSRAPAPTTRAGTSRSTSTTCCWSRSASRRRRWPARSRAAATPATTSRARTRCGARRTSC